MHTVNEEDQSAHIEDAAEEKVHAAQGSQVLTQPDSRKEEVPSQLNISRRALFEVLTRYDIAPLACSHIRGQEQVFSSRACRDESGKVVSFGEFTTSISGVWGGDSSRLASRLASAFYLYEPLVYSN